MLCPKCKTMLANNASICTKCGMVFSTQYTPANDPTQMTDPFGQFQNMNSDSIYGQNSGMNQQENGSGTLYGNNSNAQQIPYNDSTQTNNPTGYNPVQTQYSGSYNGNTTLTSHDNAKSGLGIAALVLSILGCTCIIGAILAIIDLTKKDGKSKTLSIISLCVCGLWLFIAVIGSLGSKKEPEKATVTTEAVTETVKEKESTEQLTTEEITEAMTEEAVADNTFEIILDSNDLGDYGYNVIINKGDTEFEIVRRAYYVPLGTYKATNMGDFYAPIPLYDENLVDVDGHKEWGNNSKSSEPLKPGESVEITVEEGLFICLIDSQFKLEMESMPESTDRRETKLETVDDDYEGVAPGSSSNLDTSDETPIEGVSIDTVVSLMKISLSEGFGDNYKIDVDGNDVTISVWMDGVAAGALLAQQGNEEYIEDWNKAKANMQKLAASFYDSFEQLGVKDVHCYFHVLNDQNKENTLLMYVDGVEAYDAVDSQ
ncbi:MAG: DUF4190 domain-containing protein [Eubacterium sp.]|nr:DUF4190 domain-containing protein [Eubacterium sp.]